MVDQMLDNRDSHLINGISNLDLNLSLSIVKKVIFDTPTERTQRLAFIDWLFCFWDQQFFVPYRLSILDENIFFGALL